MLLQQSGRKCISCSETHHNHRHCFWKISCWGKLHKHFPNPLYLAFEMGSMSNLRDGLAFSQVPGLGIHSLHHFYTIIDHAFQSGLAPLYKFLKWILSFHHKLSTVVFQLRISPPTSLYTLRARTPFLQQASSTGQNPTTVKRVRMGHMNEHTYWLPDRFSTDLKLFVFGLQPLSTA